jgi:hypothetical protein
MHVSDIDVPIYEVALEGSRNRLVGIIPDVECPYNGRPREQLFRIEYVMSDVWFGAYRDGPIPSHLVTRYTVFRCDLVQPRA